MKHFLGFDIGGSSVKAALVKDKKIIKSVIEDSPADLEGLLELISKMAKALTAEIDKSQIVGAGFALAGALDLAREKILNSPNIPCLNEQPLKKLLIEKMEPWPVKIEHDVHCFLLAEKEIGLAKNLKNVFYLTLGTGIGGAWMADGKIFLGAHGAAGEVGHTIIKIKNQKSKIKIDETKDLEELASNKFILREFGVGSIEALKQARAGNKKAQEVFSQLGQNLGIGLANIINIFDPEAVILSGGISEAQEFILPGIEEQIRRYVISPTSQETKILFSRLSRLGGALGAALLWE